MDIKELEQFLDYTLLPKDPDVVLNQIISVAKTYLPEEQILEIYRAYEYAREKHAGQTRLSGDPYILHPLLATWYLMEIKPDIQTIQTCLLHDVMEDCNVGPEEIERLFGEEVLKLCEWMVKVSKVKYKWEDRHLETIKKTFLAMARDLRVIFVKLADRIHNIQTLYYHPNPAKREKIAQETMKIYVPIAKRLWLYRYQLYLENWSFKVLNEEAFDYIFSYLNKYFGDGEKYIDKWIKTLSHLLKKEWVDAFNIKWRIKSPYRVYEKLQHKYKTTDISTVMDLLAYRVIAKTVSDCYMVLGIIHKYYTPLIKKIKDYIAVPKFNGYQSIHTTILGMFRFPVEIQIRTPEMDDVAEYWVAAHFAYVEHKSSVKVPEQQWAWIKKLQEIVSHYTSVDDKEQFKQELNIEILEKRIFLYTPQGDVIELPAWSTVLDFAFAIHTEIGLSFKNALVNWEIKPISYTPQTGDVIKINTFKNKYSANKHRLEFLHTSTAKNNLIKFLRSQQKEQLLAQAIQELNAHLKSWWLPLFRSTGDQISKKLTKEEIERRLIGILDKKETYMQFIKSVYPKDLFVKSDTNFDYKPHPSLPSLPTVIVDNDELVNYYLCPECKPDVWQKIIAKTWRDGIKIHTITCRGLKTVSFDKLLEAHWEWQSDTVYHVWIELKIANVQGNIIGIMKIFNDLAIPVVHVTMKNLMEDESLFGFETEFTIPSKIAFLISTLKKHDPTLKVTKIKIS